jgi:FkbM family methyltransferase
MALSSCRFVASPAKILIVRPWFRELNYLFSRGIERVAPGMAFASTCRHTHEPEMALLPHLSNPNRIAIDVGANDGVYSHLLLDRARQVIAFEPNPWLVRKLKRVLGKRVRIEEVALSDSAGKAEIRIPRYRYGHATIEPENTLELLAAKDEIRAVSVVTKTLDSFEFADVGFIKVDVEGHEAAVLRGGRETIRRCLPNLLIEVEERHTRGGVANVTSFLNDLGYEGFYYQDGELRPMSSFNLATQQNIANLGVHGLYINNFIFSTKGQLRPGRYRDRSRQAKPSEL